MLISNLFENEHDHQRALNRTGFWGSQGAGCIFFAMDTKRFLLAHRSYSVEQPDTWGVWGGAIDSGEDPKQAAIREAEEECGYSGPIKMIPMYVFKKGTFRYSNFLAIIPKEFHPNLNWESQGAEWFEFGEWPSPLHFGVTALLNDPKSFAIMQKLSSVD